MTPPAAEQGTPLLPGSDSLLQTYYRTWESRLGYRLVLGDTRHFGFYARGADALWPLPVGASLRAMEERLFRQLRLGPGKEVLDAGCGSGLVAVYMARQGLRVQGIDLVERHLRAAERNARAAGLEGRVRVQRGDYQKLAFGDASFDGVYTMETAVHAIDPVRAVRELVRVLRPGGRLAMHEYEFTSFAKMQRILERENRALHDLAAMPALKLFRRDYFKTLLEDAGMVDVRVDDISANVLPMLRYFYVLAIVPYLLVTWFGLQKHFANTVYGYHLYKCADEWRYVSISARKPEVGEKVER